MNNQKMVLINHRNKIYAKLLMLKSRGLRTDVGKNTPKN